MGKWGDVYYQESCWLTGSEIKQPHRFVWIINTTNHNKNNLVYHISYKHVELLSEYFQHALPGHVCHPCWCRKGCMAQSHHCVNPNMAFQTVFSFGRSSTHVTCVIIIHHIHVWLFNMPLHPGLDIICAEITGNLDNHMQCSRVSFHTVLDLECFTTQIA